MLQKTTISMLMGMAISLLPLVLYAQDMIVASGSAQAKLEKNITIDDLKEQLLLEAIQNAIENEFGIIVEKESFVDIVDGKTYFDISGKTYLKGEWLKTETVIYKEETRKKRGRNNPSEVWVTCLVEGLVREITKPDISMYFATAGCPSKSCEKMEFINGESMFLLFNAAVDGYLSVFVEEEDAAFRILPYQQMNSNYLHSVPITGGKEYVLFSADDDYQYFDDFPASLTDELVMTCDGGEEVLNVYIIFSQEPFSMPVPESASFDPDTEYVVPKYINMRDFKAWLIDNRVRSEHFYYRKTKVKIRMP